MTRHPTAEAAGHDASEGVATGRPRDCTAPAPCVEQQRIAEQLHVCWCYGLHGSEECRIVIPSGATRDEVLQDLEQRWPGRLVYLEPVGSGP